MPAPEILCDIRNHVACITLNRPTALNALSFGMLAELRRMLELCARNPQVRAILLQGAGDKAFCAGGDIRELYRSLKEAGPLHHEFFVLEYTLDYLLHCYPKPFIALMDGVTMGGGMGLAQASRLRIVGERTRLAMPEVSIGLFPDVGASYFLSRLSGGIGSYVALSGLSMGGADAVCSGLADAYLSPPAIAALLDDLASLTWSTDWSADVRAFVEDRKAPVPAAAIEALRPAIDTHFSLGKPAAILASLDSESRDEYAAWAVRTAQVLRSRSPTMLSVTAEQLRRARSMTLAECFRMELGMVQRCFEHGDFVEGIRAVIVDKDNAPRWTPDRLAAVTDASVQLFFCERWSGVNHPLASLERAALTHTTG